jgi:predicted ester cyclase
MPGYLELYDEAIVLHGVEPGIDGVRSMYEQVWERYPGSHLTLDDVIVEGDRLACRYTWRATDSKSGLFIVPGATIMHFRAGNCVERWDFEGKAESVAR